MNRRTQFSAGDPRWRVETTDDGSRTLILNATGDTYHSESGAIAETLHVYLHNSGVLTRLKDGLETSVLEVGLGTGMAMLVTLDLAIESGCGLDYVALENVWPPAAVIENLSPEDWIDNSAIAGRYLQWRKKLPEPVPAGVWDWRVDARTSVRVHSVDVRSWTAPQGQRFDAVYFDPFAPQSNPELWTSAFLAKMRGLLNPHGKLVTYCVSRAVRDAMTRAGLHVRRLPGPKGGKREVLVAQRAGSSPPAPS